MHTEVKRRFKQLISAMTASSCLLCATQISAATATDGVISDDFNRANSTNDLGRTSTGVPWTLAKGKWKIESGQSVAYTEPLTELLSNGRWTKTWHFGAGINDLMAVVPSSANGFVQVTMTEPGQWTGLVFRYQDTLNYWKLAADVRGNQWVVSYWKDGVQQGFRAIPEAPMSSDVIRVATLGDHIRISINDIVKLDFRDRTLRNAPGAGLLGYAGTYGFDPAGLKAKFDDFSATAGSCGNGIVEPPEKCDDGTNNGHAKFCNTTCGNYTRLAYEQPFSSDSPFNRPIGSGALYADDENLHKAPHGGINAVNWSRSMVRNSESDPLVTVYYEDVPFEGGPWYDGCALTHRRSMSVKLRIPAGVTGAGPQPPGPRLGCNNRDGQLLVLEPDGQTVHEFYKLNRISDTEAFSRLHQWPSALNNLVSGKGIAEPKGGGAGTQAYAGSGIAGVLREWEVKGSGVDRIRHALSLGIAPIQLRDPRIDAIKDGWPGDMTTVKQELLDLLKMKYSYTWPAAACDGFFDDPDLRRGDDGELLHPGELRYKGTIYMGELLAIPKTVDIDSLGLNEDARALAWTFQNYGGYITDAAGSETGGFVVYADAGSEGTKLKNMRRDLGKIIKVMRIVTNNDKDHVGGGGTYPSGLWPPPDPVPFE